MPDPQDLDKSLASGLRSLARALNPHRMTFHDYIREAWKITEPATEFADNWHIGYLAEYLTAVSLGQIKRLIVNIPPRWMKSTIISIDWPTWEWGPFGRPELRYMFVSYDQDLSIEHSLARRRILESDWYSENWGARVCLCGDQNRKTLMENTRRGKMISTSTHGGATGKGANRIIFDDFLNPKMAESEVERTSSLAQYGATFSSRLDNKIKDVMVVVEQRLHARDFTAKLKDEGGWEHVVIPTDNYTKDALRYTYPISKKEVIVQPGEIVWPAREPADIIAKDRLAKGTRAHDAQARQNPSNDEGAIFKRGRWKFYTEYPKKLNPETGKWALTNWDEMLQSWDCSFKDLQSSDFVVGQCWGRLGADRYLLDQTRDRLNLPATIAAIVSMSLKWPKAFRKLIEDKANGPAVIQLLSRDVPGLIAVNPEGGKIVRARATEPIQEAGNIWLPSPTIAPWIEEFINRCALFPAVDYDDEIDAMTQANIYFTGAPVPRLTVL